MSMEYNWTENPARLKELLDAGKRVLRQGHCGAVEMFRIDPDYRGRVYATYDSDFDIEYLESLDGIKFLDPAPKPLEPRPLEWRENDDKTESLCQDGDWAFEADSNGSWAIMWEDKYMGGDDNIGDGSTESAKSAIHEWRINHLNSMTGGSK